MYFAQTPHVGPVPDEKPLEVLEQYFRWRMGLDLLGMAASK